MINMGNNCTKQPQKQKPKPSVTKSVPNTRVTRSTTRRSNVGTFGSSTHHYDDWGHGNGNNSDYGGGGSSYGGGCDYGGDCGGGGGCDD